VSRRYRWDKSGRLVGVQDGRRGTSSFRYDPRDQIEKITRVSGLNKKTEEHFSYDALMNLAQSDGRTHRYDGGTVRAIGNSSYRYDVRGRVIEKRL
jgi:YD repeat-containing protein